MSPVLSIDTPILEAVQERDVDLLLLEELHSDERFSAWFYGQVWGQNGPPLLLTGAWHSLSHPKLGETDLVALYTLSDGHRRAILIENKVDAPPQRHQAERYRQRGESGIRQGWWDEFRTCLVAPEAYAKDAGCQYDALLSYEAICKALQELNPRSPRHEYKVQMLKAAIEQRRRAYSPRVDERVTKFWRDYWEYARRESPELGMKEPGPKPRYSYFIFFAPPDFPKHMRLVHKTVYGHVDLNLSQRWPGKEELETHLNHLLTDGLEVVRTGKSISIRARVPVVKITGDLAEQVASVREAVKAAGRLLYVARVIAAYRTRKSEAASASGQA